MTDENLSPVVQWLTDDELAAIYSSNCWNNIEEEKKKEWWIADGDYDRCMCYLKNSGLLDQYRIAEKYVCDMGGVNLQIADLAAGIGWTSSLLSRLENVGMVHSVEISKHRVTTLFEHAVHMVNGLPNKICRYMGSFYDLQFTEQSMDVIFISQGFHHADQPLRLLNEMNRILRGGGANYADWRTFYRYKGTFSTDNQYAF